MEFNHEPVLLGEVLAYLNVREDGTYVDGTLGGAGHSFKIVQKLGNGRLIGIDQDDDALEAAGKRLSIFSDKAKLVKGNFANAPAILKDLGIEKVDGILLDVGVSSYQLDNPERGFSYREDALLDMRMDKDAPVSAMDVVNGYSREDLVRILRDYGEEKFASAIATNLVVEREKKPIRTTRELVEIVRKSIPASVRKGREGFAGKTFQALRIEVNSELDVLKGSIGPLIDVLAPGGRLLIITFHSLEDRIVKNEFKKAQDPCTCPPNFPECRCGAVSKGKVVTRKPVVPTPEEIARNKRSSSAKLRVFEKTK